MFAVGFFSFFRHFSEHCHKWRIMECTHKNPEAIQKTHNPKKKKTNNFETFLRFLSLWPQSTMNHDEMSIVFTIDKWYHATTTKMKTFFFVVAVNRLINSSIDIPSIWLISFMNSLAVFSLSLSLFKKFYSLWESVRYLINLFAFM